jgi:hypothetical protein
VTAAFRPDVIFQELRKTCGNTRKRVKLPAH